MFVPFPRLMERGSVGLSNFRMHAAMRQSSVDLWPSKLWVSKRGCRKSLETLASLGMTPGELQ